MPNNGVFKIGDIVETTQLHACCANPYLGYFKDTNGVMPIGTKFVIIKESTMFNKATKPFGMRLLIDGVAIRQTGNHDNGCYHSLPIGYFRLAKSKTKRLLEHLNGLL